MKELVKIEPSLIGEEIVQTVSARELHQFLESKQRFADWIKKRIKDGGFLENKDFISLHKNMTREIGATSRIEYYITIEMAKHLGMMERTEKGYEIREYFIECEKEYKKTIDNYIPKTLPDALEAYALELRKHEETKLLLAEALPKVEVYDAIIESKNTFSMANTAQIINIEKMGRNKLMAWLRSEKVLKNDNTPFQKYINKGWFDVRLTPTVNGVKPCSRTTPKGIEGILRMFDTKENI